MVDDDIKIVKKEFEKFPKWFFEVVAIYNDTTPSKAKKDFVKRLDKARSLASKNDTE